MNYSHLLIIGLFFSAPLALGGNPIVGGEEMYPQKDIIDNAVKSKDHTTLVAAVKAADLVATLKSQGPFTVFAPTNQAFDKLPKRAVASLLEPENKPALTKVLTYHVIAGRLDAKSLLRKIRAGRGKAELKTVSGGKLFVWKKGRKLLLKDERGATATITQANVFQKNGVIHVIDGVVMPN